MIEKVEEAISGVNEQVWTELEENNTVDKHWVKIVDVIRTAAADILAKKREHRHM